MQTVWGASKLYYESCVNGESFHFQARLILKGHGQLMYMRIRYHFLADWHVTRHARETESQNRIRDTQNKS